MSEKYRFTLDEKSALLRELKNVLKHDDEREFMKILRKLGVHDEDPRFAEAVRGGKA